MTVHEQLARVENTLRDLEHAVLGLRSHLGTDVDVQRLVDDVERCSADLALLRAHARLPSQPRPHDLIVIPDGDYDSGLWDGADVDSEGLGVPGRRAP
ncbi:MAG: hypothetical protein ACRDO1_11830 [Nocardioidaceae bacterium]